MATVRELIAKLGFDVDTSGADEFSKKIKGLKKGLETLISAKVLKGASDLQDSFLESQRKIKFLSGAAGLEALNEALKTVSKTASQVDIAEAMRAGLEMTTDPTFTKEMVKFGSLLADAFGGSVQERTQELIQGALSGDFSGLVSAGLFTAQEAEFLKGANLNTVQGKLSTIFRTNGKILDVLKAQAEAEKTATFQMSRFGKNVEDVGKTMGEVISPVIAFILDVVNDIVEAIFKTDVGKIAAQFLALAAAAKIILVPLRFIGAIIGKLGLSIGGLISGFARIANIWVTIGLAANAFFKLMTGENIFKPFEVVLKAIPQIIEAFRKMGAFFGSKIGAKFSMAIEGISGLFGGGEEGGLTPPTNAESKAGAGVVDNRKAEIVINAQGANAKEVEDGVVAGLTRFSFGQELTKTRQEFVTRNTELLGANAQ